jgi:hypothetical protein
VSGDLVWGTTIRMNPATNGSVTRVMIDTTSREALQGRDELEDQENRLRSESKTVCIVQNPQPNTAITRMMSDDVCFDKR